MSRHPAKPDRSKPGLASRDSRTPWRDGRWLLLPAAVAGLHAALLWHWHPRTEPRPGAGPPAIVLSVRPDTVEAPAPEVRSKGPVPARLSSREAVPGEAAGSTEPVSPDPQSPAGLPLSEPLPPGEGLLRYRLQQDGQQGEAWLHWQAGEGRYALELHRQLPSRELPVWRSEGRIADTGLVPTQFSALRKGRSRQRLDFLHDEGLIRHSDLAERQALPPGVQDRLSWWLQLPALAETWRVRHGRLYSGQRLRLPVALLRGGAPDWEFEVIERDAQGRWLLRRQALGAYDGLLEVWLAPLQGHRLVRMVQHLGEGESWQLALDDPQAVQQTEDKTP